MLEARDAKSEPKSITFGGLSGYIYIYELVLSHIDNETYMLHARKGGEQKEKQMENLIIQKRRDLFLLPITFGRTSF